MQQLSLPQKFIIMIIKLNLSKAVILDAVKSATYIRGKIVKASANNAETVAYDLTLGDEDVDNRSINRYIQSGFEQLKTVFVDYINDDAAVVGNNLISDEKSDDVLTYYLRVSTRWNGTLTDACARLSSKYIADYATMLWYGDNGVTDMVNYYTAMLKNDEVAVRKCFIKSPPAAPTLSYSSKIQFQQPQMSDGSLHLIEGEEETITYTLDDGAIDDIETRSDEPTVARTFLNGRGQWCVKGLNQGVATITFFSRHNDTVRASFDCIVGADPDSHTQHVDPSRDPLFPHYPYR